MGSTRGFGESRQRLALAVACFATIAAITPAAAQSTTASDDTATGSEALEPRVTPDKPESSEIPEGYSQRRLHLKFAEGTDVRLRDGEFVTVGDDDLSGLEDVLEDYPEVTAERLFDDSSVRELAQDQTRLERESGREQADLNLYFRLLGTTDTDSEALLDALNGLEIVELAYAEPRPSPPPNHSGATPDFSGEQDYSDAAPDGIDADFANTISGGTGGNVRIIDIEYSWNTNHEDLSKARAAGANVFNGTPSDPFNSNDHGTAVLGEMVADNNSFGVTGLAHGAGLGMTNASNTADGYDLADSINTARMALNDGDVILLEQQTAGANGGCNAMTQNGCVAVEWVQAFYDAIVAATADGIIVVEAAGNGNEDLDGSEYGSPFPGGRADSGAIIVGASNNFGCTAPAHGRSNFSTFGARVNLHAFGECVTTTGYGTRQTDPSANFWYSNSFGGTSSASPIVTSAAAILSSVAQQQGDTDGLTSAQARTMLAVGGTPQDTSATANAGNIGPMPDLADALDAYTPVANAGGPYTTPEGTDASLSASGSTDPQGQSLTYEWDLDNDGAFDDASGVSATFADVGRDGSKTVRVKVTDSAGAYDIDEATVTVTNVAPTATAGNNGPKLEGTAVTVSGTITDAGWLDPLSAAIDWGDGSSETVSGTPESGRPDATLPYSADHTYGDNGTFTVQVCGVDDDTTGSCASTSVTITNADPTAAINLAGAVDIGGVDTFLAHAGEPIDFAGRSTDPGSDDLALSWDWGDGAPSPDVTTSYLVNPPLSDPFPSPSVQPRDETDEQTHAFGDACSYTITFAALDDDGGSADDSADVIITGNAGATLGSGYWHRQYKGNGDFSNAQLDCYLAIVRFMSAVFDEQRPLSTHAQARDALKSVNSSGARHILDQQLVAVWLNFANGALDLDELVDTDGDGIADTAFEDVVATAEAVRLDPSSTTAQLNEQKRILERINLA